MKTALLAYLLLPLLALSLPGFAGEAPLQPPYSWRGVNGSGVFPAQDIVTAA